MLSAHARARLDDAALAASGHVPAMPANSRPSGTGRKFFPAPAFTDPTPAMAAVATAPLMNPFLLIMILNYSTSFNPVKTISPKRIYGERTK